MDKAPGGLIVGNNRLVICAATMKAVLQDWLNRELASPVAVTSVKIEDMSFVIILEAPSLSERPNSDSFGRSDGAPQHT